MKDDIRIVQIVLDEEKIRREQGEEGINKMWEKLDNNFDYIDKGAKRIGNYYVSKSNSPAMLLRLCGLCEEKWFSDNVKTLYWYNPLNGGEEDCMDLIKDKNLRSEEPWDDSCIDELLTLI